MAGNLPQSHGRRSRAVGSVSQLVASTVEADKVLRRLPPSSATAVGGGCFSVPVAEEASASGRRLLFSVTSAGQIVPRDDRLAHPDRP